MSAFGIRLPVTFADQTLPYLSNDPASVFSAAQILAWHSADAGVTSAANLVSAVAAKPPALQALTQATDALKPTLVANAANGKAGFFSTANGYLGAAAGAAAVTRVTPFSVSLAFIYNGAAQTGQAFRLLYSALSGALEGWLVSTNNAGVTFALRGVGGGNMQLAAGNATLVNGGKYIAHITYDGTGVAAGAKIYVNKAAPVRDVIADSLAAQSINGAGQTLRLCGQAAGNSSPDTFLESLMVGKVYSAKELAAMDLYFNGRYAAF